MQLRLGLVLLVVACGPSTSNPQKTPDAPMSNIDAPVSNVDAPVDTTAATDGIAGARAAADGTGLSLPITGVTVTYIKPQIGNTTNDPAGFTIQHDQHGPALFVTVDPATLSPAPVVGDVVSFTVTAMGTVGMQRRAQAVTGFSRVSQGANVAALAQDISSATDLVTAIDSYDSQLVTITGTAFETFSSSGTGFQRAGISTTGISMNTNLQLRAPATLVDSIDMANACTFAVTRVPFSRFNAQAQINVYSPSDFVLSTCPAPVVANAAPTDTTHVLVRFSRNIQVSSVASDGSQFTFDNGLTASAASVSGRLVVLTTGTQTANTSYTLTVANTVTDLQSAGVGTPTSAPFYGYATPAVVRINELNANIASGCDLVELRVIASGSMSAWKLMERTGSAANNELAFSFPAFTVNKNDLIVVHLNSASTTCNPGAATAETTTINAQPHATYGANYDTAFDFYASDTGLVATNNVLTLSDAAGTVIDAVMVTDTTSAAAANSIAAANIVGTANAWSPAQATYTSADFLADAVGNSAGTGTTKTGTSIQRIDDTDDNDKADWTTGAGVAASFGALNAGQTALP